MCIGDWKMYKSLRYLVSSIHDVNVTYVKVYVKVFTLRDDWNVPDHHISHPALGPLLDKTVVDHPPYTILQGLWHSGESLQHKRNTFNNPDCC